MVLLRIVSTPKICPPHQLCGWEHSYTLYDNPSNGGQINNEPNGYTWGPYPCSSGFNAGITAEPAPGYAFSSWSGSASGTNNPSSFSVGCPAYLSVTANYAALPQIISDTKCSSDTSCSTSSDPPAEILQNTNPTSIGDPTTKEYCGTGGVFSTAYCGWITTGIVINNSNYVQIHYEENMTNWANYYSSLGWIPSNTGGNATIDMTVEVNSAQSAGNVTSLSIDYLPNVGAPEVKLVGSYEIEVGQDLTGQFWGLSQAMQNTCGWCYGGRDPPSNATVEYFEIYIAAGSSAVYDFSGADGNPNCPTCAGTFLSDYDSNLNAIQLPGLAAASYS